MAAFRKIKIKIGLLLILELDISLPILSHISIGCTCKACVASNNEKINIDFVCEIVNFDLPNLIILKKKYKNTTKYHNIFTISSFLGSENIFFYFILFYLREMLHS